MRMDIPMMQNNLYDFLQFGQFSLLQTYMDVTD